MATKVRVLDFQRFQQAYEDEFKFVGKFRNTEEGIAEYYEIVRAADEFIEAHKEFLDKFDDKHDDHVTSDRETAAFLLAALMYGDFDDEYEFSEESVA